MDSDTPAKRRLLSSIKQKFPNISDDELPDILNGVKRFVTVVQKIYTEPQAHIKIIEKKIGKKKIKKRVIESDLVEFKKVVDKDKPTTSLSDAFRAFNKAVTKDKKDV